MVCPTKKSMFTPFIIASAMVTSLRCWRAGQESYVKNCNYLGKYASLDSESLMSAALVVKKYTIEERPKQRR